jgi:hypothetical protein
MTTRKRQGLPERCALMHAAIRAGHAHVPSIGEQRNDEDPEDEPLDLYNCPYCGTTLAVRQVDNPSRRR